ncbi:hypothetical protein ABZZ80_40000 [Streptomyces sp. NPDC006356]
MKGRSDVRRWLVWFLALRVVLTLGVLAWAAVALLTPDGDGPREAVGNSQDSSVEDFLRTYDITAEPKRTSPSKVTYSAEPGAPTQAEAGSLAERAPWQW